MSCDWAPLRYDVAPQRCVDILGLRCKGTKNFCNNKILLRKNVVTKEDFYKSEKKDNKMNEIHFRTTWA